MRQLMMRLLLMPAPFPRRLACLTMQFLRRGGRLGGGIRGVWGGSWTDSAAASTAAFLSVDDDVVAVVVADAASRRHDMTAVDPAPRATPPTTRGVAIRGVGGGRHDDRCFVLFMYQPRSALFAFVLFGDGVIFMCQPIGCPAPALFLLNFFCVSPANLEEKPSFSISLTHAHSVRKQ